VFALAVLGVSVLGGFRHLLSRLGAPWYVWLLLPLAVVAAFARKEAEWMPDEAERRKWSRRVIVGALVLALLTAKFSPRHPEETGSPPAATDGGRADPHRR